MNYDQYLEPPQDALWEKLWDEASEKTDEQIREDLHQWGVLDQDDQLGEDELRDYWVQFVYDGGNV